jgi:small-conductance mechanosensitive channel
MAHDDIMLKDLLQLDRTLLHNPLQDWLIAIGIVFGIMLLAVVLKRQVIARMSVAAHNGDSQGYAAMVKMAQASKLWLVAIVALQLGSQYLDLPHKAELTLQRISTVAAFLQCGIWLSAALDFWIARSRNHLPDAWQSETRSIDPFSFLGRLILWTLLLLVVLDNLGVNITALATSLGVGGIALALAVQSILGDLFASLSIIMDKPFVIGDSIAIDGLSGTVEHIGLKTTRIRSSTGEQLVVANSDMLKARLRNYKRMQERCITFGFSVPFGTAAEVLEKIPQTVRSVIEACDKVRFDRAHFKDLSGSAYVFEVVYWVLEPDYRLYMDSHQVINLGLVRAFEKDGVQLSYPSQTLTIEHPASVKAVSAAPAANAVREKAVQGKAQA